MGLEDRTDQVTRTVACHEPVGAAQVAVSPIGLMLEVDVYLNPMNSAVHEHVRRKGFLPSFFLGK